MFADNLPKKTMNGFPKLFLIHTQLKTFAPTLLFEQGDGRVGNLKTLEPKVKQENS